MRNSLGSASLHTCLHTTHIHKTAQILESTNEKRENIADYCPAHEILAFANRTAQPPSDTTVPLRNKAVPKCVTLQISDAPNE